jgi:Helix-turn-helix domain
MSTLHSRKVVYKCQERGIVTIDDLPDFLTIEEAAKVLRIGRGQAYELARIWRVTGGAEGIPNVSFGSKTKRVPKTAIAAFLESGRKAS